VIRPAVRDDAVHLPDIERSAGALFGTLPDLAWVASGGVMSADAHERLIAAGTCWVAEDSESRLIAFLSAEQFEQDLHIWEISVHASVQGQGIGRRLIEAAVDHARHHGLKAVTLTTFRDVGWNEPYYARRGFETLAATLLSPRLCDTLNAEIAHGHPRERRCAMRLLLD
jgi:GNAT superfamily N-acetyltransferase